MSERRKQVSRQCKAVAHMARAIATVYADYEKLFGEDGGPGDSLVDMKGEDTAALMQVFGDILNGMDSVTDADDWMAPVFEAAQRMWPRRSRACLS